MGGKKRAVYGFAYLYLVTESFAKRVEAKEDEALSDCMAALMFSALSLEAYLNHLGPQVFKTWHTYLDRLAPEAKLAIISEKIGFEPNFSKRPFQTFKNLFSFRNQLAHAKTEFLDWPDDMYVRKEWPRSKWESYCTFKNVKRAREDIATIVNVLQEKSGAYPVPIFLLSEIFENKEE